MKNHPPPRRVYRKLDGSAACASTSPCKRDASMERRAIAVHGVVQGVGFRPFVYGLASRLNLRGVVKTRTGGVLIGVGGGALSVDCFLYELAGSPPPLAQIKQLSWERRTPQGDARFRIECSEADSAGSVFISPDTATCDACLAE